MTCFSEVFRCSGVFSMKVRMFREGSFRSEAGITPFMDGYCVVAEDCLLPVAPETLFFWRPELPILSPVLPSALMVVTPSGESSRDPRSGHLSSRSATVPRPLDQTDR